jgi:energy-converting hydrogenase Eha subunit F
MEMLEDYIISSLGDICNALRYSNCLLELYFILLQVVFVLTRQTKHGFVTDSTLWRLVNVLCVKK